MLIELIRGGAILTALCMVESYVLRYWRTDKQVSQVVSGLVFGLFCVLCMYAPIHLAPGVIFDARSVILAVAGLFGGPVVAGITMFIAAAYRLYLGGAGAGVGIGVIVTCGLLGLLYRHYADRGRIRLNFRNMLGFGVVVHAVCVLWFLLLPDPVVEKVLKSLVLPFLVVFSLTTPVVGLMLQDTRNRLRTEEALRETSVHLKENENLFRALFDNSPNGITLKNKNGQYLLVNKTYAQWHGREVDEITGCNVNDLFADDFATISRNTEVAMFASGEDVESEYYLRFLDGRDRFLSIFKTILQPSSDKPAVILTILTDITHLKKMEASLTIALADAERANQAKSEFLATMSHELRTPLNAIIGFSDMIKSQYFGPLGSKLYADYAHDIKTSGDHLLSLINDILDISAIEAGKHKVQYEQVDLQGLISKCVKILEFKISGKDLRLSIDLRDDAQSVQADRRAIYQILLNLMTNSVKFSDPGGTISVSSSVSGSSVRITVKNGGGIIPGAILDKVTEPFTKADPNPHISQEGSGLGLAIVKALIEAHQGSILIESDEETGTSVTVILPQQPLRAISAGVA